MMAVVVGDHLFPVANGAGDQLVVVHICRKENGYPAAILRIRQVASIRWWRLTVKTQKEKAIAFVELHAGEPFIIPNPWDAGSARMLEAFGFKALATTSSGFAFTLGRLDGQVTLDEVMVHVASITAVTDVPVSVDMENGYGSDPQSAALAVTRAAEAGAVGGSIEDWDPSGHLYDVDHAAARIAAAATVANSLDFPFTLTARAENHIRGNPDLEDTIGRLRAYEAAGADVLYAPGLRTAEAIHTLCQAVSKPVNVLALPGMKMAELANAGAQRVSVGGSLSWVAVDAAADAARAMHDRGDFSVLHRSPPLKEWFG